MPQIHNYQRIARFDSASNVKSYHGVCECLLTFPDKLALCTISITGRSLSTERPEYIFEVNFLSLLVPMASADRQELN